MEAARTRYIDTPRLRVLDLRPHGADAIPVLSRSIDKTLRKGSPEHIHPQCLEIVYCMKGCVPFVADGTDYPIHPGEVFLSRPDQPHLMKCVPRGNFTYRVLFQVPRPRKSVLGLTYSESRWLTKSLLGIRKRVIYGGSPVRQAFETIFRLYDAIPEGTSERTARIRHACLGLLLNVITASQSDNIITNRSSIQRFVDQIRKNPEHHFSLSQMAHEAQLSHVTFTAGFKALTGMTPHAFCISCRTEKAKTMLADTRTNIAAIANLLGFCSSRHFTTSFKRSTGMSPTEFRGNRRGGSPSRRSPS